MKVQCNDSAPKLISAVLFYGSTDGQGQNFATVHPVRFDDQCIPVICPGTPATKVALLEAIRELVDDRMEPEIFPEHLLAKGTNHLVWYRPATKRTLWFKFEDEDECSAHVPIPALLWLANPLKGECSVFALCDSARPDGNTLLYQAPFFNVWGTGKVCTGNALVPKGSNALIPENWEKMFFSSWFTHPNVNSLVRHRAGSYDFWKQRINGKYRVFPKAKLVPLKRRFSTVFSAFVKEGQ